MPLHRPPRPAAHASVVADLPVELLSCVLRLAANMHGTPSVPGTGLALLGRCAQVSTAWRDAAKAVLALETFVCVSDSNERVPAYLLRDWASHWRYLRISGDAGHLQQPQFRPLLQQSCPALQWLDLHAARGEDGPNLLSVAYLQALAAAMPAVRRLSCSGYIPTSVLPADLEDLSIGTRATGEHDIAALLLLLQGCRQLQRLAVQTYGTHLHLCRTSLGGLQLPQSLRFICLSMDGFWQGTSLDLSWLALPRTWKLSLAFVASEFSVLPRSAWARLLQDLHDSSALQPQDALSLTVGEEGLSLSVQQRLASISLAEFFVELPP